MDWMLYRYSETGVFGYLGYADADRKVCGISCAVYPGAPVTIAGERLACVSPFGAETTLVPGYTARQILHQDESRRAGILLWTGGRSYILFWDGVPYHVRCDAQQYALTASAGEPLLVMKRVSRGMEIPDGVQQQNRWLELTPMFRVHRSAEVSDDLAAVFCAMPMLEFGL